MNRVYLVRHGENRANLTKEFSCRKIDYPLTVKGIEQAEQTAEYFMDKRIDALFSSPLKRAVETAEILGRRLDLPVTILESFREHDVGDLEGASDLEGAWRICGQVWAAWLRGEADARCPGGENLHMMRERFRTGLVQVVNGRQEQNLVVVGHGGIFTGPLTEVCPDLDIVPLLRFPNHNCSVTEMRLEDRNGRLQGTLLRWASIDHLRGAAAQVLPGWLEVD